MAERCVPAQRKRPAESRPTFIIRLIAEAFLSLTPCDTYHWLKQAQLMCFQLPSFLNSYFWKKKKKRLELGILGAHKCIFKVWMLLSGIDLRLGWQTSQVHEVALATWSFVEKYILKMLSWPSSNMETSTFLAFSQPKRTKFSSAESVFSVDSTQSYVVLEVLELVM